MDSSRTGFTKLLTFYRNVYGAVDTDDNYNKVPHDTLKIKVKIKIKIRVKAHGIDGKSLRWIRSWLSNRQQSVTINGSKSNCGMGG